MIELDRVTKKYNRLVAVDQLSLSLYPGEIFGFIGPNGAGKTTTIQMIAGLTEPTSGNVTVCGIDMKKHPQLAKQKIGFIPDRPYLYERLTAMEFLKFTADLFAMDPLGFEKKALALLEMFSLGRWADEMIEAFSHGMKQRLIMAAALIHDPELLVVDEPMVGLDPLAINLVKGLLRQFAADNKTVFMSTHTLSIAGELCDRVGVINKGRLLALGTVEELKTLTQSDHADLEELFMILTENGGGREANPSGEKNHGSI